MILASYYFCWLVLLAAYTIQCVQVALWIVETVERVGKKRSR